MHVATSLFRFETVACVALVFSGIKSSWGQECVGTPIGEAMCTDCSVDRFEALRRISILIIADFSNPLYNATAQLMIIECTQTRAQEIALYNVSPPAPPLIINITTCLCYTVVKNILVLFWFLFRPDATSYYIVDLKYLT